MEFYCRPVGFINSPFRTLEETPNNGREKNTPGTIEILPEFSDCLLGLEKHKFIMVLSWFHLSDRTIQKVTPKMYIHEGERGVFSTRSPVRPNPIALTLLELEKIEGLTLYVKGLDMIDKTPILDIKKYDSCLDAP